MQASERQLYNASRDMPLCRSVFIAHTPWQRLRGLLGRPELQPGTGLLLLPSKGIHTFGMRYAIDAVLLDEQLQVLHVYHNVKPSRIRLAKRKTHAVLELPSGEAQRVGIGLGDRLHVDDPGVPESLLLSTPTASSPRGKLSPWVKLLLVALLTLQGAMCWSARSYSMRGWVDLRAYYSAGTLVRFGSVGRIYDDAAEQAIQQTIFHQDGWHTLHFLYPPFAVLPFVPLSLLSYQAAFFVVLAGNLGCLFVCAWLLTREHPEWRVSAAVLWLFFLCFFPTASALLQGQVSFALLLVVTLFYCLERRGWSLLAGVCLSVGLLKFQIMLPVALLYLLWRRYRVVAGFAMGSAALLLLSLWLTGLAGLQAYVARLGSLGASTLLDQHAAHLRYAMVVTSDPNLHGLATMLLGHGKGGALLTAGFSLLVLLWSARQKPSAAIAITSALLLSYHLQLYGLLLFLLPLTLLVMERRCSMQKPWQVAGNTRYATWLLDGSVLLLAPPLAYWLVMSDNIVWFVLASFATLGAATLPLTKPTCQIEAPADPLISVLVAGTV